MGTEETAAFIARVYDAYARGDMDTVFAALADDIEWCSQGAGDAVPWGGSFSGREGVAVFFERVNAAVTVEAFEVVEIIAQDDRAAVITRPTVRFRSNGRTLTVPKADIVRMRDGKVVSFCEYYDTGLVAAAMQDGGEPGIAVRAPPI